MANSGVVCTLESPVLEVGSLLTVLEGGRIFKTRGLMRVN